MAENEENPYQAAIDAAVARLTQRERDMALYGCYVEVDGKRVDPMTVHYERVERPANLHGKSLVQSMREEIAKASKLPPQPS